MFFIKQEKPVKLQFYVQPQLTFRQNHGKLQKFF